MSNIGKEIKKARQSKNISIAELSNSTSIRTHIIQAIEEGNLDILPSVYMKSFVRTLVDYLQLDASLLHAEDTIETPPTSPIAVEPALSKPEEYKKPKIKTPDKIKQEPVEEALPKPKLLFAEEKPEADKFAKEADNIDHSDFVIKSGFGETNLPKKEIAPESSSASSTEDASTTSDDNISSIKKQAIREPVLIEKVKQETPKKDIPKKENLLKNKFISKKSKKLTFDDGEPTQVFAGDAIKSTPPQSTETDFTDLFKKKKVASGMNPGIVNYLVYAGVALLIIVIIYFTFFFNSGPFSSKVSKSSSVIDDSSVVEVDNSLFDVFAEGDSLSLSAKSRDSAWLKIEVDGKTSEEILMLPGMERTWNATEFFTIHQGNIGAIDFYRNGKLLENFGKKGTVVRNVKITRDEIIGDSPWQNDPTKKYGSVETVPKETKRYNSTKPKKETKMNTIEPSKIETKKPDFLQPKRD